MIDYNFTDDWATHFRVNAERLFQGMEKVAIDYLEIGTFEGRSACWMLDNVLIHPQSRLSAIDLKFRDEARSNLLRHHRKATLYEGDSKIILPTLSGTFDIVYIDGDHTSKGALFDSVTSWPRCKVGGIVLWDDYFNSNGNEVQFGVERFCDCLGASRYEVLLSNYQFAIRKLKE